MMRPLVGTWLRGIHALTLWTVPRVTGHRLHVPPFVEREARQHFHAAFILEVGFWPNRQRKACSARQITLLSGWGGNSGDHLAR